MTVYNQLHKEKSEPLEVLKMSVYKELDNNELEQPEDFIESDSENELLSDEEEERPEQLRSLLKKTICLNIFQMLMLLALVNIYTKFFEVKLQVFF